MHSDQSPAAPRILILDATSANGSHARDCLETIGLPAIDVRSIADLQAAIAASHTDLVILDGDDMEAIAALGTLKSNVATLLVPVLAVCGQEAQAQSAFAAGADEQVTRTAGPRSLLALVATLLEQGDVRRHLTDTLVNRERYLHERLHNAVSRYLSPQLTQRILDEVTQHHPQPTQQRTSTRAAVMFADMRGFTSMAERLDPDDTVSVLDEYFALLTEIAFRHEGTVFSMSGDSLMIGYGVPAERQDSAARAIETAAEMLREFRGLADRWHGRHGVNVGLGIGINDGRVLAGDVGSPQFMSYTMIGDTVNVASRLSQRARAGEMLFSGSVKRALDEHGYDIGAVALPPLTLRGRSAPLDIFCVPLDERLLVDA